MNAYYMSFCDPAKVEGSQFIGACLVQADTEVDAMTESHLRGCNPGGEIMLIGPMPINDEAAAPYMNRLLSREEAENMPDVTADA